MHHYSRVAICFIALVFGIANLSACFNRSRHRESDVDVRPINAGEGEPGYLGKIQIKDNKGATFKLPTFLIKIGEGILKTAASMIELGVAESKLANASTAFGVAISGPEIDLDFAYFLTILNVKRYPTVRYLLVAGDKKIAIELSEFDDQKDLTIGLSRVNVSVFLAAELPSGFELKNYSLKSPPTCSQQNGNSSISLDDAHRGFDRFFFDWSAKFCGGIPPSGQAPLASNYDTGSSGYEFGCFESDGVVLKAFNLGCESSSAEIAATGLRGAVGYYYSCFILEDNTLKCWGKNNYGQVGNGTNENVSEPALIAGDGWAKIRTTTTTSCGIRFDGRLFCWGYVIDPILNTAISPVQIGSDTGWTHVAPGNYHICAINQEKLYCWGRNNEGQLGLGYTSTNGVDDPALVGDGYKAVATGHYITCAIQTNGDLYCFGDRQSGALGDGETSGLVTSPELIDQGYVAVEAWNSSVCAQKNDLTWKCWGQNYGQYGDGTKVSSQTPASAAQGQKWKRLDVGEAHACGIDENDDLYCWGANDYRQLGDGTRNEHLTPEQIHTDVKDVFVGGRGTCAVYADDLSNPVCWGVDSNGLSDPKTVEL